MEREGFTNKKNSIGSLIIQAIVLCGAAIIVTALIYGALNVFKPNDGKQLNKWTASLVGGIVGVLFHLSCMIVINVGQYIAISVRRLADFFQDLKFSFKIAVMGYKENVRENGLNFLVYFLTFAFNAAWFAVSLINVLKLL